MEESHFNSSPYFWPAVPTVSGQVRSNQVATCFMQCLPRSYSKLFPFPPSRCRLTTVCSLTRWRSSSCPQRRAAVWLLPTIPPYWLYPPPWPFPPTFLWILTPSQNSLLHTVRLLWRRTSLWCLCSLLGSWQQVRGLGGCSSSGGVQLKETVFGPFLVKEQG